MTTSVSSNTNSTDAANQGFMFPASFAQRRLWFLFQLYPDSAAYNIPGMLRIKGPLNVEALERSLQEIVRRHETLRTRFAVVNGEPHQIIELEVTIQMPVISLTSLPIDREAEARRRAREEAGKPFDLARGPLLRASLLRLGELDHVLLLTMHHIISDGWSMGVLVREASVLYPAFSAGRPSPLPELPIQYADFSEWHRERLQGDLLEQQLAYWRKQLEGLTPLELPTDYPRPAVMGQNGASVRVSFSAELKERLQELNEQQDVTLFMTLLAAFQVLLYRYTGQKDIVVGSPVAGRTRTATEGLIGFFVNTLVLRTKLSHNWSFIELLRHLRETTLGAYAHQDVPFEKLVGELQPERDLTHTPLFQVMFALQNAPVTELQLGATKLEPFDFEVGTAKFDLMLTLNEGRSAMHGLLEYNADLFNVSTTKRMAGHFETLLSSIVSDPGQRIADLPLLMQSERQQLLVEWNRTRVECPSGCIHEWFAEQARKMPKALAVRYQGQQLIYQELDRRANQLARYLRKLGIGPETLVGICVERSLEMVVGLLGVLKAGGAYVPMDPNYPSERLRYMIEDSRIQVLLIQEKFREWMLSCTGSKLVRLDLDWDEIAQESEDAIEVKMSGENLAYVIYTSGSSGMPKGVGIPHAALSNHMFWMKQSFGNASAERVLQKTPFGFDASVWEFYAPLLNEGVLVMAPPEGHQDSEYLVRTIQSENITVLQVVPSLLELLVQEQGLPQCKSLKWLFSGGEALSERLVTGVKSRLQVELINLYGPTEATIDATFWRAGEEDGLARKVAIGTPIFNTRVYVLDEQMQPVPVGVVGQLYIGGAGLARGYWSRPDLTAERFVPDSLSGDAGTRLYWTGDRVRWRDDHNLEYLGRADEQVKVRGHRIELGEIESALLRQPAVKQAAVMARKDARGQQLVGYVVPQAEITMGELRQALQQQLPHYMVPTIFVMLDALPLLPSGKVDRKSLPPPTMEASVGEMYTAPRTPAEELLAQVWSELLGIDKVGVHDDFFQLGGHSLLAVRMRTMIHKAFDLDIPLASLFQNPTIAHLAKVVTRPIQLSQESSSSPILVSIQSDGPGAPFFCVHPIGGNVLCYAELASALSHERPFYGLQSRIPVPGHESPVSIEQMAELYNTEIRQVQPTGPYLLGGWSMGGLVSFEMAKQLSEQGETIGLLAMFDTHPPSLEKNTDLSMLARFAADMSRQMGTDTRALSQRFLQLSADEQWNLVMETLIHEGVLVPDAAQRQLTNLLEVFTRNSTAIDNYSLQKGTQQIILFQASDTENRRDLAKEWSKWGSVVEFHLVPGDHYTVMRQPHVSAIVGLLKNYLVAAEHRVNAA
jgi:amino acid adenylation domain-containing protein